MLAKLTLWCNSFKCLKIVIDITSFNFYGATEDYDYGNPKRYNAVSFRVEPEQLEDILTYINGCFNLNPVYCKVEEYLSVRTEFEEYMSDKRPCINIKFDSGMRGLTNPPSFNFESVNTGEEVD